MEISKNGWKRTLIEYDGINKEKDINLASLFIDNDKKKQC
jgi:hypothetical protein